MAGAGFTLRVEFLGVCAFVPDQPFFTRTDSGVDPGEPRRIDVLVPEMRTPVIAHWEKDHTIKGLHMRASHWPVLLYDTESAVSAQIPRAGTFVDPKSGRLRAIQHLAGEVITFQVPQDRLTYEDTLPNPLTLSCPPEADERLARSLWWLPQMAEISPDHAYAKAALLASTVPDELAGRMILETGHLSVSKLNEHEECSWEFRTITRAAGEVPKPGGERRWQRAVGNQLVLEIPVASETVVLQFQREGVALTLRLKPLATGYVDIAVANMEPESLFFGQEAASIPENAEVDVDFEALYALAASTSKSLYLPYKEDGEGGEKYKPCAPAAFQGARES